MDRTLQPTFSLRAFNGHEVVEVPITKTTGEVFELREQIALIVRSVRDGQPLPARGDDGLWSVAMCLAAQKSARTGHPVAMGEILGAHDPCSAP
jgi:myo-inositol 2-dehydrogenase/D-chiro-inositol 1-dehydrogenase